MITKADIITAGKELVGFREEQEIILSASLKLSNSGLFVNDLSGVDLLSIKKAIFTKADLTAEETVSEYLASIFDDVLINTILTFLNASKNRLRSGEMLSYFDIIKNIGVDKRTSNGSFVGYYLEPKDSSTIYMLLSYLSLKTENASQNVRIFLYDLNKQTAIKTEDYTTVKKESLYRAVSDWFVKYRDINSGSGLKFLIGYYESDTGNPQTYQLGGDAYFAEQVPGQFEQSDLYMRITPIIIPKAKLNFSGGIYLLPDVDPLDYSNTGILTGLSVRINAECDYTQIFVDNIEKFAEAFQYNFAIRILSDASATKEFNAISESQRTNWTKLARKYTAMLRGYDFIDEFNKKGHYKGILEELTSDFAGIDNICFPLPEIF